jgi:Reverse transcriptase (RNA-dependent DNA polymerase)
VHEITHGKRILDKVFTNRPDLFRSCVSRSLLKTKHMAVIVSSDPSQVYCRVEQRKRVAVYDVRAPSISRLRAGIMNADWSAVYQTEDVTEMYSLFLQQCKAVIGNCVPFKMVRLGPRDPDFVTPLIKSLLKTRNNYRRRGRIEQANVLAVKINRLIAEERSHSLARLDSASPKKLWDAVRKNVGSNSRHSHHPLLADPNIVNDYFANISYDSSYKKEPCFQLLENIQSDASVEPIELERYLKRIKPTSPGPDGLPRWFFHECSVELADIVSYVISQSLKSGIVPDQWKVAYVSPVPKTRNPASLADFRPISVTSILSRVTEKLVVRNWLMPAIPDSYLVDQFGFRRTGSTTCALVYLTHYVTEMLESHCYVRCLCVDFSKAFDVVDHNILSNKLALLQLPVHIFHWLLSFLTGRTQQVKVGTTLSVAKPINRGTIQGSGIGPTDYVIMASDLRALSRTINKLFKYADDTTLLVPEHTDFSLEDEFIALQRWADSNKMILNLLKTKEIVFHRPDPRMYIPPVPLNDIEQVQSVKLLGVYFSDTLRFDEHVKYILTICGQRLYLLKTLRGQGLSRFHLNTVFQSLVLSRLAYALPAWGGFLMQHQIKKINSFLSRAYKYGYFMQQTTLSRVLSEADHVLFNSVQNAKHCLHGILPPEKNIRMALRKAHCFKLPNCHYKMFKESFINRAVFKQSY